MTETAWNGNNLKGQQKTFDQDLNLPQGLHYIELWADKSPVLKEIGMDLGNISSKRIPTVDDPEWTGDFNDDTEQMIFARAIFGEARSAQLSDDVRIAVAWTIKNRVDSPKHSWGTNYHEVVLQAYQFSAFNIKDVNRSFVENPLKNHTEIDRKSWHNCYEIAAKVMNGLVLDPTAGANHYVNDSKHLPNWAKEKYFKVKIGPINFYEF